MQVIANLSLLFTELPLLQRIGAARQAGFAGVEIQFPYAVSAYQLRDELLAQQMPLYLINLPAGDLMEGGAGLACQPDMRSEFSQALESALEYALIAKPKMVNVLAGRLLPGQSFDAAMVCLAANLRDAARAFARQHCLVTCEAINPFDMPGFLLNTPQQLLQLLREVRQDNCLAQLDLYHMARQEIDLLAAIDELAGKIGHVQFADCPGRNEPGTGTLDFMAVRKKLAEAGYGGVWAAEYIPSASTATTLGWLQQPAFSTGENHAE